MAGLRRATALAVAAVATSLCQNVAAAVVRQRSSELPLHPSCASITCADISCPAPFELTRSDGQCCPVCWAPDHVVGLDRHESVGDLGYRRDPHPAAPSSCGGVKCFAPHCMPGQEVGHVSGRCCATCVAR
eukprot:TRINITY_DN41273_c0_g1_i1.p1 TRINITY_DN41273_c0_g1~~TRINITY_DN41273_c0_g1_i1.p1  ORF type:complete len:151 (-),score=9.84 TRINITY_DN41273_c0_g1_i1:53-445(-)